MNTNNINNNKELLKITQEEVSKNDGMNDNRLWIIINNKIYDVTDFKHPGGREALEDDHGEDRGDEFYSIHSEQAIKDSEKYLIGELVNKNNLNKDLDNTNLNYKDKDDDDKIVKNKKRSVLMPLIIIVIMYFVVFKYNLLGLYNRPENKNIYRTSIEDI